MSPNPDLTILTQLNEEAKQCLLANNFVDALKLYDEGLEKFFEEQPKAISGLLKAAQDALPLAAMEGNVRSAAICAFVLRMQPNHFEAMNRYVSAMMICRNPSSEIAIDSTGRKAASQRKQSIKVARLILTNHLAKVGVDEKASNFLENFEENAMEEMVETICGACVNISVGATPETPIDVLPQEAATLIGNNLNNAALCELKLKRYDAAAASAGQALLFLSAADARARAVFRHAQALLRSGSANPEEAAEAAAKAERHLKKAEVKVLREMSSEAQGKHDFSALLKECLKDEKKKIDPIEFLSNKIAIGESKTKGLGLVARDSIKKGEILCVQQAVHFVPPKSASDSDDHLDFTKVLLAEVLKDPRSEIAVRILAQKGQQIGDKLAPEIQHAFRRLSTHIPLFRDQIANYQIWEDVRKRDGIEKPIKLYEGTADYDAESRHLASSLSEVVKKMTRQSSSLALSFDTRYTKTMTQTGGDQELGQVGLWTIPSMLHHGEFPNVTFGTMGGVAVVTAIRDVQAGDALTAMMGGIQCLPQRLRHLSSLGICFPCDCDPDYPLTEEQSQVVKKACFAFEEADTLKMETIGLDPGDQKPKFEKAIDVCMEFIGSHKESLEAADPLGLAALYFTLADCLGGKKDLSGMVKAYYMGVAAAHSAIVFNLDTLTRMTKMQKFLPAAKKLEEMQDQAEMVAKNNPSLKAEFDKIAKVKNIGPSIGTIQEYLEENLTKGCELIFSTPEAFKILS